MRLFAILVYEVVSIKIDWKRMDFPLRFLKECAMLTKYDNDYVKEARRMELNDIYNEHRELTGRVHCRGTPWQPGEYGVVVCVWVYDGRGHLLLTRRAKGKSFAGTWENSGGAAQAGESSREAIARELFEETGIKADPEEFEFLDSDKDRNMFYDHYCLKRRVRLKDVVLLPGETDDVMWASFGKVHWMIRSGKICKVIAHQFYRQENALRLRNMPKFRR